MGTSPPDPQEVAALRGLVDGFIQERLQLKLEKLKGIVDSLRPEVEEVVEHRVDTRLAACLVRLDHVGSPASKAAIASRTWAASAALLRLFSRVLGLIASITRLPAGSAWRRPRVLRLGSSSGLP